MPKTGDRIAVKGTSHGYYLAVLWDGSGKPMDDHITFLFKHANPGYLLARQLREAAAMLLMLCPQPPSSKAAWRVGSTYEIYAEGEWWVFPIHNTNT